ncbi:MAG: hypothetical protein ABIQ52_07435 [Vicinamibacterales bacterium]
MSLYDPGDERRIRLQARVREWTKSGLLDPAQGAVLEAELRVDVRRTNVFLRAGLALFTVLIIAASVMLTLELLDLDRPIPSAITTAVSAVVCLALAQYLVVRQRFYRFGVEEALAAGSVALIATSAIALTYAQTQSSPGNAPIVAGLLVAAAGGLGIYWRFGYVYAVIGALVGVACVPFQLELPETIRCVLAAAALSGGFAVARLRRTRWHDDYPGDDYALIQAAAWAGLYLTLNLQLRSPSIAGPFYWFTYAAIWTLPIAGIYLGIRDKDRALLDVSLVMALVSLLTNKAYLGWPRHTWDPIVLGVILMATAVGVRRWLSNGTNAQRSGFTASRLLSKETGAVTMLGNASARLHPDGPCFPDGGSGGFGGGRSGGGGATGSY